LLYILIYLQKKYSLTRSSYTKSLFACNMYYHTCIRLKGA